MTALPGILLCAAVEVTDKRAALLRELAVQSAFRDKLASSSSSSSHCQRGQQ